MADKKISQLNQLTEGNVSAPDMAAVADISANETRKVSIPDLAQSGIRLMPDGTIAGSKLEDGAVTSNQLGDDAVTVDKIVDGAVTEGKLGDGAVTTNKLANDAVTSDKIADDAVQLNHLDAANYGRGLDKTGDNVGITNSISGGTFAGITYTDEGLISSVDPDGTGDIPRADLPIATESELGVVSAPATGGLAVAGTGALSIDNTVTAGTNTKITYDEHGLVTAGESLEPVDLPIATTTTIGAVQVPTTDADGETTPLEIEADGSIEHSTSGVQAGTYEKLTVDKYGHVTAGGDLLAADIPDIEAGKITSGTFPTASATPEQGFTNEVYTSAIANQSISRRHFNDISISYIQETLPPNNAVVGSDATVFRGCLWFRESTGQLYMFDGNSWKIVAGGQLAQENLRFMGTFNAATNQIVALTDEGVSEQKQDGSLAFTVGDPLPTCDDALSGTYFLIDTAGSALSVTDVVGNDFAVGDLVLGISQASGWTQVAGYSSGGGGGGSGFWQRTGAAPDARLTPVETADNLFLQGGDWLTLPHGAAAGAPAGGPGSIRWDSVDDYIEVWDGTQWRNLSTGEIEWETIPAADNADWAQDVIRTKAATSDVAVRLGRSIIFEAGTQTSPTDSGAFVSQLNHAAVTASQTWTLPDETGTLLTDESTIDCGTY